jgi:hypothetical protein
VKESLCQLLNVHEVNKVRQTGIHMDEPLVPDPSGAAEVQMGTEKLNINHQALIKFQ